MSSSTKMEVFHYPREIEAKRRRSSRLNRKYPGSYFRESPISIEAKLPRIVKAKMPKIVKSSSSTEKAKLEILYSPNKGSPKVIKSHEDSENSNNKSRSSSKMSFWVHQTYLQELKSYLMQ
jgi:hypothetical protein